MHLHRLLPLLCGAIFFVGCVSKPSPIEDSLTAQRPSAEFAKQTVAPQHFAARQYTAKSKNYDRVKYQLKSSSESDRILACEELGRVAITNTSDTESIDLLADIMKNDESMKVRLAATDALGLLRGGAMHDRVASMLPSNELPKEATDEPPTRLSFIKQLWR